MAETGNILAQKGNKKRCNRLVHLNQDAAMLKRARMRVDLSWISCGFKRAFMLG